MQNTPLRVGPVALAAAAANILNSAIASLTGPVGYTQTQPYILLTHIRVLNKSATAANVSLFIGATGASAAGTEFAFNASTVSPNSAAQNWVDWYGRIVLKSTEFLTGFASAATALTLTAEGEIGLQL